MSSGETIVFDKKLFMAQMDKWIKDDEYVIFSNNPYGRLTGASKKIPAKRIGIAFTGSVFKDPESIGDVISSKVAGVIICKKTILSDDILQQIEEFKTEADKNVKKSV